MNIDNEVENLRKTYGRLFLLGIYIAVSLNLGFHAFATPGIMNTTGFYNSVSVIVTGLNVFAIGIFSVAFIIYFCWNGFSTKGFLGIF